jgi:hypothetical protein
MQTKTIRLPENFANKLVNLPEKRDGISVSANNFKEWKSIAPAKSD